MAVYVVMEPPARGHDADATTFVRDGFSWLAFVVSPLWLLWHGLWVEAALAAVGIGLVLVLGDAYGLPSAGALLVLLAMIYVGLEGQALRIAALSRRGWRQWGVVVADNLDDADARYVMEAKPAVEQASPEPRLQMEPSLSRPAPIRSIGLVPFSGKH